MLPSRSMQHWPFSRGHIIAELDAVPSLDAITDRPALSTARCGQEPVRNSARPPVEIDVVADCLIARFTGTGRLSEDTVSACWSLIQETLQAHGIEKLVFDLARVSVMPSAYLGILVSFRRERIKVQILNPTPFVRTKLRLTRLDRVVEILHDTDESVN